jgi:hypothetical protein
VVGVLGVPIQAQQVARLTREVELLRAEVAAAQLALAGLGAERDAARGGAAEASERLKVLSALRWMRQNRPLLPGQHRMHRRLCQCWWQWEKITPIQHGATCACLG